MSSRVLAGKATFQFLQVICGSNISFFFSLEYLIFISELLNASTGIGSFGFTVLFAAGFNAVKGFMLWLSHTYAKKNENSNIK